MFVRPAIPCKLLELLCGEVSYPQEHQGHETPAMALKPPLNPAGARDQGHEPFPGERQPRKVTEKSQHGAGHTYCHCGPGVLLTLGNFTSGEKPLGSLG